MAAELACVSASDQQVVEGRLRAALRRVEVARAQLEAAELARARLEAADAARGARPRDGHTIVASCLAGLAGYTSKEIRAVLRRGMPPQQEADIGALSARLDTLHARNT